ncbi:MAG: hypothetical protein MI923_27900 [Phycisphaerales bacterium]|nr:hypothetical protein [Phycisphaerales bacterium]
MNEPKRIYLVAILMICSAFANRAEAASEPDRSIPQDRQTKLLESFGSEGIDANNDGVLTRDEVHRFFGERRPPRPHGQRRMGEPRRHDRRGPARGPKGHHVGRLLKRLEFYSAATPPEGFSLSTFAGADLNGDDQLSHDEWTQFSARTRSKILTQIASRVPHVDADENGVVSDEELASFKAEHVSRERRRILSRHPDADTDENGELSDQELENFASMREAKHRERILERHPVADLDANGSLSDGELEAFESARRQERRARILERHPEADLDGDGVLAEEEAESFRKNHPKGSGKRHRGGMPRQGEDCRKRGKGGFPAESAS